MENIDLTCDHQQKCQLEIHQRVECNITAVCCMIVINFRHVPSFIEIFPKIKI